MNNEGLILDRLLEIQEDIGSMKSKQDALEKQMEVVSRSMTIIEKNYEDHAFIRISRKQLMVVGGSIITAALGYLGIGRTL